MFDDFLARFIYQCHPNNTALIRSVHENDDVYLMAFPAYKGEKKTLLPLGLVMEGIEKTQASHLHDAALLTFLDVTTWNIGLMPCKLTIQEGHYVILSPGGARYLNGYVSNPDRRPVLHDYHNVGLYTWVIVQKNEHNENSYFPAYELESILYYAMQSKTTFRVLLPLFIKGMKDVFKLNDVQCREFLDVYGSLHERACQENPTRH